MLRWELFFLLGIYPFTQVRPPRPATICALAQRLRLRSESQREEVVEEQERKREEHLSRGESAKETKTENVDTARRGTGTIKESASPSRERRRSVLV